MDFEEQKKTDRNRAKFPIEKTQKIIREWELNNSDGVTIEITQLLCAWKSLKAGKANERQQLLCREIVGYLMDSNITKKEVIAMRYVVIQAMIDDGLSQKDAIQRYIATRKNHVNAETLGKGLRDAKRENPDFIDDAIKKQTKRKFHQLIDW